MGWINIVHKGEENGLYGLIPNIETIEVTNEYSGRCNIMVHYNSTTSKINPDLLDSNFSVFLARNSTSMKVQVDTLKHHPVNREIYNLTSIDELVESIKSVGLLQPLTVDQHNQVVSGNRRFEAIKRLGWKKVEVNRITVKNGDDILLLIHFNKQRIKSIKEILTEYDHLRRILSGEQIHERRCKGIREKVGTDIQVSDGNLARILFIRKHIQTWWNSLTRYIYGQSSHISDGTKVSEGRAII